MVECLSNMYICIFICIYEALGLLHSNAVKLQQMVTMGDGLWACLQRVTLVTLKGRLAYCGQHHSLPGILICSNGEGAECQPTLIALFSWLWM